MILDTEFPLSTAAELLDVKPRTLQSWVQYMPTERVEGGGSKGNHRRFSFHAIMQTATALKLIGLGVSASRAFEAASEFANFGGTEAAGYKDSSKRPDRLPSLPYHSALGDTYLCADAKHSAVVCVPKGSTIDEAISKTDVDADGLLRVNMWPIYTNVVRALTDDYKAPFDLLNDSYGIHNEADLQEYAV